MRNFFIENALFWLREYHFDALRLDALHMVFDQGAKHIIQELTESVASFSRESAPKRYLIGESDLDDVRFIKPAKDGGHGLDAQWLDDLHHSLHALITGENTGYYEDFGRIEQLAKAMKEGFVYSWQYSRHRKKFHGSSSRQRPARQFVVFAQNHDHIGNRLLGERLSNWWTSNRSSSSPERCCCRPTSPCCSWGRSTPRIRRSCTSSATRTSSSSRPCARAARSNSRLSSGSRSVPIPRPWRPSRNPSSSGRSETGTDIASCSTSTGNCSTLRRGIPHVVSRKDFTVECLARQNVLIWHRRHAWGQVHCLMNFDSEAQAVQPPVQQIAWVKILDSADAKWEGPGATLPETIRDRREVTMPARSLAVFQAGASIAQEQARRRLSSPSQEKYRMRIPSATYRLQFSSSLRFNDARALVPYLAAHRDQRHLCVADLQGPAGQHARIRRHRPRRAESRVGHAGGLRGPHRRGAGPQNGMAPGHRAQPHGLLQREPDAHGRL